MVDYQENSKNNYSSHTLYKMAIIGYQVISNLKIVTNLFLAQSLLIALTKLLFCPKPRTMATIIV